MKDHRLTILHAPLHGVSATPGQIKRALGLNACSAAFSEAYPRAIFPYIITRPRYPATVAKKYRPLARLRGAHDTPILRRRHHKKVDSFHYKAVGPSTPIKIAPDRWNTGVAYEHSWGVVGHVTAHPNAAVMGMDPRQVDRAAKYVSQMQQLEQSIRAWRRKGYTLVVTGDLNYGAGGPWWAPDAMFSRLNMRTWQVGVDWIAWDKRLELPWKNRTVIRDNGQDHPWLLAEFQRAG